jgi:thiamine biosynthesis lipoprotein
MIQLLLCAIVITGSPSNGNALVRQEHQAPLMGTTFRIVLLTEDEEAGRAAAEAAFARADALNAILSDYDSGSEIRRLCDSAPHDESVRVSAELWEVLHYAREVSRQSQGAFDVTVGPLVRLWRQARRTERLPSPERLQEALSRTGWRRVEMDSERPAVRLPIEGMRIDLGAIAKGYAADECLKVLGEHGISRALIDAGGDIVLGDPPPGRRGWRVAVAGMDADAPPIGYLLASRCAVASSGDTWQYAEIDGMRYSHIVDPATGLGLTERRLVTVVAPSGMAADAWASAVSVLGPGHHLPVVAALGGFEARIAWRDESGEERSTSTRQWGSLLAADALAAPAETEGTDGNG